MVFFRDRIGDRGPGSVDHVSGENTERDGTTADLSMLDSARRGDSDSLADLWIIYQPQLLRMLRAQGRSAAEDIASQVWIDVRRNLERFEGDGVAFRNWIFTIAYRRAIDEGRRRAHRNEVTIESIAPRLAACRAMDPLGDSLDNVLALLSSLQPVAADVVMLRVIYDLPVSEVAAITGESESNVRVLAHRALERLRQTIEEGGAIGAALSPDVRFA